jgi:hypothetical protein
MNLNRKIIGILLGLLLLAGCSSPGNSSTQGPPDTQQPNITSVPTSTEILPTPSETPSPSPTGTCANLYYPVREGVTWFYKSTGSAAGDYSFIDTITSARADGFTLTSEFNNLTRTQEWACKSEGLVALQLGGTSAATLNTQDMQMNLTVNNVSGVTYPSQINAGDQWEHGLDFTGKVDIAGQSGEAEGNAKTNFTALGIENMTVPVGTFDAMKVQVDSVIKITARFQGVTVPVEISGSYTYWLARDIGWIKASGTSDFGGQTLSETIELQSYNIP